jgi:tetratricopeptide (TPR) repeat protein
MEGVLVRARSQISDYRTDYRMLMGLGYLAEAYEGAKNAAERDPAGGIAYVVQGLYWQATNQHAAAIDAFEQAVLHGYSGGADNSLGYSYWSLGHTAVWNAINADYFLDYDPELLPLVPFMSDLLLASMEDRPDAIARLRRFSNELGIEIEDLVKPGNRFGFRVDDRIAVALGYEEKVVERFWSNSPKFWMWAEDMSEMRQSDAFKDRVRESGLLAYWQKHGWPDLCRAKGDDDFECD